MSEAAGDGLGDGRPDPVEWAASNPSSYGAWALWRAAGIASWIGFPCAAVGAAAVILQRSTGGPAWLWAAAAGLFCAGAGLGADALINRLRTTLIDGNLLRAEREEPRQAGRSNTARVRAGEDTDESGEEPYTWDVLLDDLDECLTDFDHDLADLRRELDWPPGDGPVGPTYGHGVEARKLRGAIAQLHRDVAVSRTFTRSPGAPADGGEEGGTTGPHDA
ncbi:hypothetical protein [Flexivirga caeni]|uniref:Uncharacterized protein n=1 Tax=Flexivirga caeni TaxID=2294115 RepID=A0A3M9MGZ7_9MICO|nr:hypothetical protein [Flexivirga caeni]RNI24829.1 hypothetical protein EFY87_03820 [Flexivirga caeni]